MSVSCSVCGKTSHSGNNVSHSNKKTKRRWLPNLQRVHAQIAPGVNKYIRVCTRCIRSGKVTKAA